jgi:tetratricopeptide (TPR) repeat protein
LAVHWAHRVAGRFPDGQLYVNLRGFDPVGSPMDPAEAVRGFLEALGVPADRVPAGVAEQVGRYRSLLAGRRVLVVLDNARDSEQVRPLLPGSSGCVVVVTSRDQLAGLVATDGARPVRLDLLSLVEARQLVERRLGPERVGAEPAAVDAIVAGCARLPLALAVVAARAAMYPDFSLRALAAQLRAAGDGLDAFGGGEARTDLRAVFSWSYDGLGADAARLFRLLGLHTGPDIAGPAVASLAGVDRMRAGSLLGELVRAQLVTEHTPGRYSLHDLLRAYAAELAGAVEPEPARHAAIRRVVDHYLHTAHVADRLLKPHHQSIGLGEPGPGVTIAELDTQQKALEWFSAEHRVLVALVEQTARAGLGIHTWQLARVLGEFLNRQGHWHDQLNTERAALAAAQGLADRAGQAQAHRSLARACLMMGRYEQARIHFQEALDQHAELGDRAGQAIVQLGLARVAEVDDRLPDALDHSRWSLELFRDTDHHSGRAAALNAVGWYAARLGDHQQALAHCRQALALSQQIGFRHAQAAVWDSLGYIHRQLGDHREATTCYRQALRLYREAGDRYNEADVLTHLGEASDAAGDPEAARGTWRQAVRILDELGHQDADQLRSKLQ